MDKQMDQIIEKASTLIEALPYLRQFSGKTVVIKYGGNAMINDDLKNHVMEDITLLKYIGINPVVIHGGGPDISGALNRFGIESNFINGLRVTDAETMRVAQMVLIGKTNKEIVSLIQTLGGSAVGVSGIDGGLLMCDKCYTEVDGTQTDIGYVGEITSVNTTVLTDLMERGYIPVVAPIGTDKEGNSYNVNADTVAGAVAEALQAEKLILLTDIEGVKNSAKDKEAITSLTCSQIDQMIADGIIVGGMIPKVNGAMHAIEAGVTSVHILDGRVPHCLLLEIFTKKGIGTMIKK